MLGAQQERAGQQPSSLQPTHGRGRLARQHPDGELVESERHLLRRHVVRGQPGRACGGGWHRLERGGAESNAVLPRAAQPRRRARGIEKPWHGSGCEWETLPRNWENSHNFTVGLGWKKPYAGGNGTCVWEKGRSSNSTVDGCSVANHATMRRFQQEFSAAVAPAMATASKHGAFVDSCATCHCEGMWNGAVIDGVRESDALEGWLLHDKPAKFEANPIL